MVHSVHLKEDYTSVKMLLSVLRYDNYGWEVIGDFKMVPFLMGLQDGFFASRTAGTLRTTMIEGIGHSVPCSPKVQ